MVPERLCETHSSFCIDIIFPVEIYATDSMLRNDYRILWTGQNCYTFVLFTPAVLQEE